jgi:hypothetical protein
MSKCLAIALAILVTGSHFARGCAVPERDYQKFT